MSFFQSVKNVALITIIFYGLIKLFIIPHTSDFEFSISRTQVKYHSNWTESYDKIKYLSQFQEALKLPLIETLDVSFSMSSSLTREDIARIFPHQLKPYHTLKLNLGSVKLGTSGAEYVMSLIPNGVQNLELYFDSINGDNDLGRSIANKLNQLTSLKKAKVSLILSSVKDEGFATFFKTHKISDRLQNLRLVFIGNQLNHTAFKDFPNYLKNSKLNTFGLNLYANNIGAQGAKSISEGISQSRLKDLDIDLYFNNITEVGTKDLCDSIATIQSLDKLSLNFDFNYIKNEGAKQIGQVLKKLPQLSELHIGVASKNFGYLGFKSLIDGMSSQKGLKALTLRCGVNRVGINGAALVNKMLQGMESLQSLNLGFVENYIGDEGLKEISETVATKIPKLKHVDLDLGFNDAKGYGGISALKSLSAKSWEKLDLRLSHNEFRDSDVKLMKAHIKEILKKTKSFVFEFMDTAVSKIVMADLQKIFEKYGGESSKLFINSIIPEQQQQKAQIQNHQKKISETKTEQKPKVEKVKSEQFDKTQKQNQEVEKKKEEAEKKQKEEAEKRKNQEAQRKQKQQASKQHKQEAEKRKIEETKRKIKQQTEKKQKENEKKLKQQAEKKRKQQIERKQSEQAERKNKQELVRKQKEQAELKKKEEVQRKIKQQFEKKQRQDNERKLKQQMEKKQKEQLFKKQKEEAERKNKEELERKKRQQTELKEREEAQKKIKQQFERKQRQDAERKQKEDHEKRQREQGENKQKEEPEKKEKEESAKKPKGDQEEKKSKKSKKGQAKVEQKAQL